MSEAPTAIYTKAQIEEFEKVKSEDEEINEEVHHMHIVFAKYITVLDTKAKYVRQIVNGKELARGEIIKILGFVYECIEKQEKLILMEDADLKGIAENNRKIELRLKKIMKGRIDLNRLIKLVKKTKKLGKVNYISGIDWAFLRDSLKKQKKELIMNVFRTFDDAKTHEQIVEKLKGFIEKFDSEWSFSRYVVKDVINREEDVVSDLTDFLENQRMRTVIRKKIN